ncbi:MAG: DNA polymerase III subunit gamma/tau [Clostridia bacterium]|jgi:DNA polymerase-3 subunit gamma/tau
MSINIPLAIKYRPKNLNEIVGQPVVVKAFTNAFKYKTLHHAYILHGGFGGGKTSMSRIIAAMENCIKGPTLNPCGVCKHCVAIFNGKSHDIREIDAASNRGIEDIRGLKQDIYQSPIECRTKYILIDEVHSLTGIAAESALKMIEEPPTGVRFILCTTEFHKIIDTIKSRCISWQINKVGWTELYNHIKQIADKEGVKYEDSAIKMIARSSKGSVRNSLQNLQKVVNYIGEGIISDDVVNESLGVIDDKLYFLLIDNIINDDPSGAISNINTILEGGKEISDILNGINAHLGILMKIRACKKNVPGLLLSEDEIKRYCDQAERIKGQSLLYMMKSLREISFGVIYNLDPQVLLESFTIESIFNVKKVNSKS